jgi:hypothetical protein
MALVLKDRVKETSTTTGTGTITLAGAVSGFQSFSNIGNANTTYYTIAGGTEWEVGLGTYTSSGNTLSRDTILESSNGGSLVNFSAGTKDVFVTYPAEKSVDIETPQTLSNKTLTSSALNGTVGATTPAAGTFTNLAYTGTLTGGTGVINIGSGQVYKDASGNVGIGTTTIQGKFNVGGGRSNFGANSETYSIAVGYTQARCNSGQTYYIGATDSATPDLVFSNASGTERMRIDSAGNVGIGTSSPTQPLSIYNSTNTTGTINVIGDGNSSSITNTRYSNDTSPPQFAMQKAAGTFASPTVVTNGWQAGQWTARAFAGTNFRTLTNIISFVDTVVSDTNISGILAFNTNGGGTGTTERMRITSAGNVGIGTSSPTQMLTVNGAVGYNAPITVTDATHTVATTTNWIIANRAGTVTLTLPAAASFTGRILTVKNVQAQTVISASSDVVPIGSTSAGTAILSATAGKFATIVSDGTNWIVMQAN